MAGKISVAIVSVRCVTYETQVLFYANSGTVNSEGVGYISLYLSCEVSTTIQKYCSPSNLSQPTAEEKESAVDGKSVFVTLSRSMATRYSKLSSDGSEEESTSLVLNCASMWAVLYQNAAIVF